VATLLPEVELAREGIESTPEAAAAHAEEWTKLSDNLRQILGPLWTATGRVFCPTQKEEPIFCSLANGLAEIYLDLKDALKLLKRGVVLNDIHWDWRFDFRSHGGKHAVSTLTAMHYAAAWDYE